MKGNPITDRIRSTRVYLKKTVIQFYSPTNDVSDENMETV